MENKLYNTNIQPANRLSLVNEYYFSTKGKEVAQIADELEEDENIIQKIYDVAITFAPDFDATEIYKKIYD